MQQKTGKLLDISRLSYDLYRFMHTLCLNDEVILLEQTHALFDRDYIFHIDHVCIAFVLRGEGDFLIDNKPYHIEKDDMFVITQQQEVARQSLSVDFEASVLMLSRQYVDKLDIYNKYRVFLQVRQNPIVRLTGTSLISLPYGLTMIAKILRSTDNPFQQQTVFHLIMAYFYGFAYYLRPLNVQPQCREEEVCLQFMELMEQYYQTEHSVAFYAERLNLSARYVSACVKAQTGATTMEIISNRLMEDAKKALLRSDMTISQISYKLGFGDPSSFGRFFKTNIGSSPREWRDNQRKNNPTIKIIKNGKSN